MHDVPDRNFGGHQADKGSGHGGDGRGGADLALSGRAAHLQGNDSILTPHISVRTLVTGEPKSPTHPHDSGNYRSSQGQQTGLHLLLLIAHRVSYRNTCVIVLKVMFIYK